MGKTLNRFKLVFNDASGRERILSYPEIDTPEDEGKAIAHLQNLYEKILGPIALSDFIKLLKKETYEIEYGSSTG
jgi:hypothetical protein